jgi:WD40 repeat protein
VTTVAAFAGPDGRTLLATGSTDGTVRIWDVAAGREVLRLVAGSPISALCVDMSRPPGILAIRGAYCPPR